MNSSDPANIMGSILGGFGTALGIINTVVLIYSWFRNFGKSFSVRSYGIAYTTTGDHDDLDIVLINKNRIKNLGVDSIRILHDSSEVNATLKGIRTLRGEIEEGPIYFRQLEKKTVRVEIYRPDWDKVRDKKVVLEIRDTDDRKREFEFDYMHTNGEQREVK
jgi:hypothetical protein